MGGLSFSVGQPRGAFNRYVDEGYGIGAHGLYRESFAEDTNFDDAQFSWGGGAGVLVPLFQNARSLVFLDLGARYHDNGRNVRYLREGGIRDLPGGGVQMDVIRSRADLVTWHVGVSVGGR